MNDDDQLRQIADGLARLVQLFERSTPAGTPPPDFGAADAFVWRAEARTLEPIGKVNRVELALLKGIDRPRDILVENTARFARGLPANNVLLWGARGMGKSSLVKAVHAAVNAAAASGTAPLKLIEIHREDIETLPELMKRVRGSSAQLHSPETSLPSRSISGQTILSPETSPPSRSISGQTIRSPETSPPSRSISGQTILSPETSPPSRSISGYRFILFCDDLSFDAGDTSYKSLKAALEGGIEGRPDNAVFYATSNRRHLMPRDMMENERSTAIAPSEAVEEKVSLSDRFGLWLGFHRCSQDEYLAMVRGYADHYRLKIAPQALQAEALEWATTRGSRSGRVAWQFVQDLAGRLGVVL